MLGDELQERPRPGLFAGEGLWPKHTRYEIVSVNGWPYVRPAAEATITWYRPLEHPRDFLRDFLAMVGEVQRTQEELAAISAAANDDEAVRRLMQRQDTAKAKAVLRFADRYGLLGIFHHYISYDHYIPREHSESGGEELVLYLQPGSIYPFGLAVPYVKYAKRFFPDGEPPPVGTNWFSDSFLHGYSESIQDIRYATNWLWHDVRLWETFRRGGFTPEDEAPSGVPWKWELRGITAGPIQVGLVFNGKLQLNWEFKSLIQAAQVMLLINMTTEEQQVRLCELPTCGAPYIAVHPAQKTCSPRHAAVLRQRRKRAEDRKRREQHAQETGPQEG
ncbi:hypothetical protein [Caldinitratiruptor microaerophilus]|uniref:Uncharacterized protein n=1 Tax=Caldinitratiruptor microaerophilus TaxID=671077 RepID=A0AA35CP90_9FIRM|nr:hypothetical protein [Caldinitratiruptor microaerophilus]BDG62319.1 hypothetical protein caldi_34090 [Caldinitratiruptor microaerophilus]